ncbi:MAG: DsbE family thiol:disulfide interchange protein [Maricaulaceae bacterium]
MMRAILPLIIFIGLIVAFGYGLTRDPAVLPSELLDKPIPEFSLPSLEDPETQINQDIFKDKVTLLNVFGSWCVACVQEHSQLMDISKSSRVQLIGVDWRDERPAALRWLERYGNPYARVIFDEGSLLAIDLGVTGAPESFIVDKAGRVRYKHVGIITPKIWREDLKPLIKSLQAS